jgi:hypothetical protein
MEVGQGPIGVVAPKKKKFQKVNLLSCMNK